MHHIYQYHRCARLLAQAGAPKYWSNVIANRTIWQLARVDQVGALKYWLNIIADKNKSCNAPKCSLSFLAFLLI
jgi:hypothetical protein